MKKILVIEDNEPIRENTAELLELANYRVYTAENGKKGLTLALEHIPDLIICDIMMPELDGYGVLHVVQSNPAIKQTPFIFLTAKAENADFRKGMGLGADDYIIKPFDATDLLNAVERRLKKAEEAKSNSGETNDNEISNLTSKEALFAFVEGRHLNIYKKKQLIFSEGNRPTHLYYIKKGKVKLYKSNEEGKELVIGLYTDGDFFGYVSLLEGAVYTKSAEAMETSEIAAIPKKDFEELMNSNPEVTKTFISLLAKDVSEKEQQLVNIAYNSLRKKVANALLSFQKKFNTPEEDSFEIDVSRENLATMAGTATESLIRTLSDFKNEKLIDISGGSITILNAKKLQKLVN